MPDIDLDKVLGAMENENVANNAMSLTDMLDTANKVLGQVTMLMDKFEKMGLKPLLVRGMGAKLGVDAEKPLATDNVVVPRTETHKELYDQLNRMSDQEITEMFANGGNNEKNKEQELVSNE